MTHQDMTGFGRNLLLIAAATVALASCTNIQGGPAEDTVIVYRGLDARSNGKAKTSPSQFRFNPDMSTFDAPPGNKPCAYAFVVTDGAVQGLPGYTGAATPPPGHWSINAPVGTPPNVAAAAAATYATANPNGFTPAACVPGT
ncbi:hypothetical protein [Defluviimonas sp. SAOS-178_SWC]|uniref:hypothetical protein n=1 Tax=Defluviimonas sp. SAOS-178_SWC TaxID=3121287 RepID=UPI0032218F6E